MVLELSPFLRRMVKSRSPAYGMKTPYAGVELEVTLARALMKITYHSDILSVASVFAPANFGAEDSLATANGVTMIMMCNPP